MYSPKRKSALAGLVLVLALALVPAAQAAGPPVLFLPASWLESGLERLAGWWQEVTAPGRSTPNYARGEKIGMTIDPDGANAPVPPPANASGDIGMGIDPNG